MVDLLSLVYLLVCDSNGNHVHLVSKTYSEHATMYCAILYLFF